MRDCDRLSFQRITRYCSFFPFSLSLVSHSLNTVDALFDALLARSNLRSPVPPSRIPALLLEPLPLRPKFQSPRPKRNIIMLLQYLPYSYCSLS